MAKPYLTAPSMKDSDFDRLLQNAAAPSQDSGAAQAPKKKRKGAKAEPILASLNRPKIAVEAGPRHFTVAFDGARLFSLNEIFSILEKRSFVIYDYKKRWKALTRYALNSLESKPFFPGPCKVTLFRQGEKLIDLDSLDVMFKYIIDALKNSPKEHWSGILPDDNPNIIKGYEKSQAIGSPVVALRIEQLDPEPETMPPTCSDLFDNRPLWSREDAPSAESETDPLDAVLGASVSG